MDWRLKPNIRYTKARKELASFLELYTDSALEPDGPDLVTNLETTPIEFVTGLDDIVAWLCPSYTVPFIQGIPGWLRKFTFILLPMDEGELAFQPRSKSLITDQFLVREKSFQGYTWKEACPCGTGFYSPAALEGAQATEESLLIELLVPPAPEGNDHRKEYYTGPILNHCYRINFVDPNYVFQIDDTTFDLIQHKCVIDMDQGANTRYPSFCAQDNGDIKPALMILGRYEAWPLPTNWPPE